MYVFFFIHKPFSPTHEQNQTNVSTHVNSSHRVPCILMHVPVSCPAYVLSGVLTTATIDVESESDVELLTHVDANVLVVVMTV